MVGTAAGVLVGLQLRHRCIAVDHLTIHRVDPDQWDQVFLLAAETTFKIRADMHRMGDKLVVICTSDEPGLERWPNFFFPHWLMAVIDCNRDHPLLGESWRLHDFDALLGRAKDARTRLLMALEREGLLERGLISYHTGGHYRARCELDASPYYKDIWHIEESAIRSLYGNELNYTVAKDSTTRLPNGHFSSCLIPTKVYSDSKVTVVAETDNYGDHVFVTEKTWKPFYAGKSAIFYATPRHEKFLEKLGFAVPNRTDGDPERVVDILKSDYCYLEEEIQNNRMMANPDRWISKLYHWLDQFRT